MAKKIAQFYYKSDNANERNRPSGAKKAAFIDGTIFADVFPISQLGIQGLPGTKFYLNGNINPIVIGASGIYDLDIKNGARVTDLSFATNSMNNIDNSNSGYLIVDVLYGEED